MVWKGFGGLWDFGGLERVWVKRFGGLEGFEGLWDFGVWKGFGVVWVKRFGGLEGFEGLWDFGVCRSLEFGKGLVVWKGFEGLGRVWWFGGILREVSWLINLK